MRLEKVDRLLAFLEENIDEKHCMEVEKRHSDAIGMKSGNKPPLTIYCNAEADLFSYAEAFDDPEKMLYNELIQSGEFGSVVNSVNIKDDYPLQIRSNHGIAISHNLVGGQYILKEGLTSWTTPVDSIIEYKREWKNKPYDLYSGVPGKVIETYRYYAERLSEYPACKRSIRLSHPDMQGPFSIAQSLLGENIFYELFDHPEDVHWLLARITDAYIDFHKIITPLVNDQTSDGKSTYIMGAIFPGNVLIKEDTSSAFLSKEHIEEFCNPYNDKIADALGNISIHYCGRSQPFHHIVYRRPKLVGINFGDPQKQDIKEIFKNWRDEGVAVINWGFHQSSEFIKKLLVDKDSSGFTFCCSANDINNGAELIKRYRNDNIIG